MAQRGSRSGFLITQAGGSKLGTSIKRFWSDVAGRIIATQGDLADADSETL